MWTLTGLESGSLLQQPFSFLFRNRAFCLCAFTNEVCSLSHILIYIHVTKYILCGYSFRLKLHIFSTSVNFQICLLNDLRLFFIICVCFLSKVTGSESVIARWCLSILPHVVTWNLQKGVQKPFYCVTAQGVLISFLSISKILFHIQVQ
jgi:hypothetical protein